MKHKTLLNNIETAITSNNVSNGGGLAICRIAVLSSLKSFFKNFLKICNQTQKNRTYGVKGLYNYVMTKRKRGEMDETKEICGFISRVIGNCSFKFGSNQTGDTFGFLCPK